MTFRPYPTPVQTEIRLHHDQRTSVILQTRIEFPPITFILFESAKFKLKPEGGIPGHLQSLSQPRFLAPQLASPSSVHHSWYRVLIVSLSFSPAQPEAASLQKLVILENFTIYNIETHATQSRPARFSTLSLCNLNFTALQCIKRPVGLGAGVDIEKRDSYMTIWDRVLYSSTTLQPWS